MSPSTLTIRRRVNRPSPLRDLRIGDAARSGRAANVAFPGIAFPQPDGGWRRPLASALSIAAHVSVLGLLFAVAWFATPPEKDEPIPIQLVHVKPPPPPPVPKVEPPPRPIAKVEPPTPKATPASTPKPPPPAPAPKALAERRSVNFAPSAQTISPQIVNPSVIAKAAPSVDTRSLESSAPREIQSSAVAIQAVQAVTNVAAPTPSQIDIGKAGAPALRGPVQAAGVAGPSVGPKAIAAPSAGASVGIGKVVVSGDGSSVREGVVSNRDVLGSPDGARIASANTNVGQGNLRGSGEGTTLGGDTSDCDARPEVRAYMSQLKERTLSRWSPPPDAPGGTTQATLRWQLDVGGSASSVELLSSRDKKVGATVVEALRSASPFPPMNDRVRCLAERRVTGTFSLQVTASSGSVAN